MRNLWVPYTQYFQLVQDFFWQQQTPGKVPKLLPLVTTSIGKPVKSCRACSSALVLTQVICQIAKPQTNNSGWGFSSLAEEIVQLSVCTAVLYNRKLHPRDLVVGLEITGNLFSTARAPNPLVINQIQSTHPSFLSCFHAIVLCWDTV